MLLMQLNMTRIAHPAEHVINSEAGQSLCSYHCQGLLGAAVKHSQQRFHTAGLAHSSLLLRLPRHVSQGQGCPHPLALCAREETSHEVSSLIFEPALHFLVGLGTLQGAAEFPVAAAQPSTTALLKSVHINKAVTM